MPEKIGPYTVVSQLGRGGMGVVYKCRDEALNRFVAIKVLTENLTDDPTFLQRFVREAQAAASLSHPNVVQIHFIGHDESNHPYFVMEYVSGRSLDQILRAEGRIDDPRASQLMLQAAHGLAAAHGIIHRDIKPANLMLDDRGLVKIADFGLALPVDAESRLTATGMFVGTPGYISPEQCAGEKADHRTDIYALGVTYYTLLTGTQPFRGESPLALMKQILDANPPDVSTINPHVNPESRRILAKMIAKDREQRYQSCHELVADLENLLPVMGVRSMTAGLATRTPTAAASSPAAIAAMSAPTAIVAGGASSPAATPTEPPSMAPTVAPTPVPTAVPPPPPAAVTRPDMPYAAASTSPALAPPMRRKGMSTKTILVAALLAFVLLAGGGIAAVMYGTKLFRGFRATPVETEVKSDTAAPPSKNPPQEALLSQSITPSPLLASGSTSQPGATTAATPADAQQQPAAEPVREPAAQSSVQVRERESAPARVAPAAREPQRRGLSGVAVAAIGDEAIVGAVASVLRSEAEGAGLEAVDAHSLPSTEDMLRGRAALRELIAELRDDGYAVLMLARIEPTGQRELSYYGRRDTAYSARITVTPYDLSTGRPFGRPQSGEIRYTSINVDRESQDVVTPLARAVAEMIRAR
jgi:tRNA A-37 threonylcarbamoyl transferase component Bud32